MATQLQIKNTILSKARALGNSNKGLKDVCSDLLNAYGGDLKAVTKGTYLCRSTLEHLQNLNDTPTGNPYRPQAETLERVLKYFGAEINFSEVKINPRYRNKPKPEQAEE